jgi:hypothetical protein
MPNCCSNCFNDSGLKSYIFKTGNLGRCGYCFNESVHIIPPQELSNRVEFIMLILEEKPEGDSASEVLEKTFEFINPEIENPLMLLSEIIGEDLSDKKYSCTYDSAEAQENWVSFKQELVSKNRYFPTHSIYLELFQKKESLLSGMFFRVLDELVFEVQKNEELFRARLSDARLDLDNMGAPPSTLATAGRANPAGISYLYLAKNEDTAIAEVRPYNSCGVSIASFSSIAPIKFLNLTSPRKSISPSKYDESEYLHLLTCIELLETFAYELAQPIKPERAIIDYVPTQFLCEYIKSLGGFKGIIFNSSFGTGNNYVVFEPSDFVSTSIRHGFVNVRCSLAD